MNSRIITRVEEREMQPFASVTVTVYVPALTVVALEMLGFWTMEVNPFGPVQLKLYPGVPPAPEDARFKLAPLQIGLLELAVDVRSIGCVMDKAGLRMITQAGLAASRI